MTLLEYLLILTGVLGCTAAPASDPVPPGHCPEPPYSEDKELQGDWNAAHYPGGTQATYTCRPGFSRLGSIKFICSQGQWVQTGRGECRKKSCGHPGDIEYGSFELIKEEQFVFGAVVEYKCDDGYQMISKHKTRECTATGWTNYPPHCEVKKCRPVEVDSGVRVLSTALDDEYSSGHVVRFECKNVNQKLTEPHEIYCTSQGEWNLSPPTCQDIKCDKPVIPNGYVDKGKQKYNKDETIEYKCNAGYRSIRTAVSTCTDNEWNPTPVCEEIICRKEYVTDGKIKETNEIYKLGDTVTLQCNEGFVIELKPEEPRTCTAYGWSPPLRCISKKCDRPDIQNGALSGYYSYYAYHYFPMAPGRYFDYYCNEGYLTPNREQSGRVYCRKNGWDPEPLCKRTCRIPSDQEFNAKIHRKYGSIAMEGERVTFQCIKGYTTLNGQRGGEIQCLQSGETFGEKCTKYCKPPTLDDGHYKMNSTSFDIGSYVTYECNEGFVSSNARSDGRSKCTDQGWDLMPTCKAMTCSIRTSEGKQTFKYGDVIHYTCPQDLYLENSNSSQRRHSSSSQCYYYGWGPKFPYCVEADGTTRHSPILRLGFVSESTCPPASSPETAEVITGNLKDEYVNGDEIEIRCKARYVLFGSGKVRCEKGKWQSPPWCIFNEPCGTPPIPENGEIIKAASSQRYGTRSTVKYRCRPGYHISGYDENTCMEGEWLPVPLCIGDPCNKPDTKEHRNVKDVKDVYQHGETATFECSGTYRLSAGGDTAKCLNGKWTNEPTCIDSSCGPPKEINNGKRRTQRTTYLTGEIEFYNCDPGFALAQGSTGFVTCQDGAWTNLPTCKRVGLGCGPPPALDNGDILETIQQTYRSGSSVQYQCANYYKLEGNKRITCLDGEWEKKPVCRVPCTVTEAIMQQNNIKRTYGPNEKLYSEHADSMSFSCLPGYEISDYNLLRVQCLDGVINYPKCLKRGTCLLQQEIMISRKISYNQSPEIENGKTIKFQCIEGTETKGNLEAQCKNKQIEYPQCTFIVPGPCVISQGDMSAHNIYYEGMKGTQEIQNGVTIAFKCVIGTIPEDRLEAKCQDTKIKYPKCTIAQNCTISKSDTILDEKHIELSAVDYKDHEHGAEVNVKCKPNFIRPGSLKATCGYGKMKYPRCLPSNNGFCRIDQDELDQKSLKLHEKYEDEGYYTAGETVEFKCTFGDENIVIGKCEIPPQSTSFKQSPFTYPSCETTSAV